MDQPFILRPLLDTPIDDIDFRSVLLRPLPEPGDNVECYLEMRRTTAELLTTVTQAGPAIASAASTLHSACIDTAAAPMREEIIRMLGTMPALTTEARGFRMSPAAGALDARIAGARFALPPMTAGAYQYERHGCYVQFANPRPGSRFYTTFRSQEDHIMCECPELVRCVSCVIVMHGPLHSCISSHLQGLMMSAALVDGSDFRLCVDQAFVFTTFQRMHIPFRGHVPPDWRTRITPVTPVPITVPCMHIPRHTHRSRVRSCWPWTRWQCRIATSPPQCWRCCARRMWPLPPPSSLASASCTPPAGAPGPMAMRTLSCICCRPWLHRWPACGSTTTPCRTPRRCSSSLNSAQSARHAWRRPSVPWPRHCSSCSLLISMCADPTGAQLRAHPHQRQRRRSLR